MITTQLRGGLALLLGMLMSAIGITARADAALGGPAVQRVQGPLSVMVLGSGGPQLQTSGRASAGYLVFTDGQPRVLMDLGGGTFQRIAQSGAHIGALDIILLSHLHIDHSEDLPAVIKGMYFDSRLQGSFRTAPFRVWGPGTDNPTMFPSVSEFTNDLFDASGLFRYLESFVDGGGLGHFAYETHDLSPVFQGATIDTILDEGGLVIKAIAVDHFEAPAIAYRIEYGGRSIVYSGDTHSTTDNMINLAQGADLLIYDTSILDDRPPPQSPFAKRHTTPTRLGQVAAMANPAELVLSHLTPVSDPEVTAIKKIIRGQGYAGKINEALDLKVYNAGMVKE